MPHHDHSHGESHEHDPGLLRRVSGISIANLLIGLAELSAGAVTHSSTLSMAGMHDISDAGLYFMKRRAITETDPARRRKIRRFGAAALISLTSAFGVAEIVDHATSDKAPDAAATAAGLLAAGANVTAAVSLHSRRNHEHAHDTWAHVATVDVPAALVTVVAVPLSVRYPGVDIAGTAAIMGLAAKAGVDTYRDTAVPPS